VIKAIRVILVRKATQVPTVSKVSTGHRERKVLREFLEMTQQFLDQKGLKVILEKRVKLEILEKQVQKGLMDQ